MKQEALRLALEWFKCYADHSMSRNNAEALADEVVDAIEKALAQTQEPVAWITPDGEGFRIKFSPPTNDLPLGWDALYTHPPQRTEQGDKHA